MTNRRFFLAPSLRLCLTCLFVLFALCALAAASSAQSTVPELDQDNGLPDAQIGTPLKAMTGLKQIEDTGRWLTFVRPGERLEFLGVSAEGISYNFFKEKLYSINIEITGKLATRRMLKVLKQRYGKDPSFDTRSYPKVTAQMEIREWKGTKLYCVFKSSSEYEGGVVTLLDRPTWDQLQVPRQEKEAKSRSMLKNSFTNGDF